jgi:hypothetical protein
MSKWIVVGLAMMMVVIGGTARADVTNTYYVSTNGTPTYPFDTWAKATTNLQLAVLVAEQAYGPGTNCVVLVTNGTYTMPTYGYYGYQVLTATNIVSISGDGTNVTVVTAGAHGIAAANVDDFANSKVGQWVNIAGNTTVPAGYRGAYRVASVANTTTFTYRNATTNAATPGADATAQAVSDFGMIRITKPITLASVNGYSNTILNVNAGSAASTTRRGIEVTATAAGALIQGFTVQNANHRGSTHPNLANGAGGGAFLSAGTLKDCRLRNNYMDSPGNPRMIGAGVYIASGATVSGCVIENNSIGAWGSGGAGFSVASGGAVSNTIIRNNSAATGYTSQTEAGGGGYAAGGTIRNCLFTGNTGPGGGGLYINGSPTVENCTFSTNWGFTATGSPQNGQDWNRHYNSAGGVFVRSGSPVLRNNIYSFNQGQPTNGMAYQEYNVNTNRLLDPPAGPLDIVNLHSYSCAPELGIATSPGNTTNDPLFVNRLAGDYRLTAGSPCVNAGTNLTWMTNAVDLSGTARLVGQRPDMGAYELPPRGTSLILQ